MAAIYNINDSFDATIFDGASVAFGVFDGVHSGHRYLLDQACKTAQESGGTSIALTFHIDPDELFHADKLKKLMGNDQRLQALSSTGVDAVCVLPFTREFASASPADFLTNTFADHAPAYLHVGQDFRFGAHAAGEVADLNAWAATSGTTICAHHLVSADGLPISATRIRALLQDGKLDEANKLLGYPYTIVDVVQPGRGDGSDFGFATANLEVAPNKRVLAEGVYGGYAMVDGVRYRAAIAVGVSPLFRAESSANFEVHILDYAGDLYGKRLAAQFIVWLRPMIDFASTEELIATVQANIAWVRDNLPL